MFPLIAIAGAISAVASVAKGASWLSAHVGASKTASAGGNAEVKPQTSAKALPGCKPAWPPTVVSATIRATTPGRPARRVPMTTSRSRDPERSAPRGGQHDGCNPRGASHQLITSL